MKNFYPRPPRGGRPPVMTYTHNADYISIHALREEGDAYSLLYSLTSVAFLSTPSARRATAAKYPLPPPRSLFLSTPSARRATQAGQKAGQLTSISIHALREEGDNPRFPSLGHTRIFLSTPSARRATISGSSCNSYKNHFYPRPPRGGRQVDFSPLQPSNTYG